MKKKPKIIMKIHQSKTLIFLLSICFFHKISLKWRIDNHFRLWEFEEALKENIDDLQESNSGKSRNDNDYPTENLMVSILRYPLLTNYSPNSKNI